MQIMKKAKSKGSCGLVRVAHASHRFGYCNKASRKDAIQFEIES